MRHYEYDDDIDYLPEDPQERRAAHIGRMRVAAGVMDFLGVVAGMVAVLALVALLISLVSWLMADMSQTFTVLQHRLQ